MEEDKDLKRFAKDEDDIKPIDPSVPASIRHMEYQSQKKKEKAEKPSGTPNTSAQTTQSALSNTYDSEQNIVAKGAYIDLLKKDPALRMVYIGAGWDQKTFDDDKVDVDLSCFMIDKTGKTREDEDFVFYNNERGCEGAVKHMGDSRTGAGDGDDETIFVDMNGIPFDVLRVMFTITVYDENNDGRHLGQIRNLYIRLVNREDDNELVRLPLTEDVMEGKNGFLMFCLVREGPRWYLEALAEPVSGGLPAIATRYGIVVKEMIATG